MSARSYTNGCKQGVSSVNMNDHIGKDAPSCFDYVIATTSENVRDNGPSSCPYDNRARYDCTAARCGARGRGFESYVTVSAAFSQASEAQ